MKKIWLVLFLTVFLVGTAVSAMGWDNGLKYEENDLKVIVENGYFFGIGEWFGLNKEIGTAELNSHPSVNYVREVGAGNQIVMWYDFAFKENYKGGLGKVEFTNVTTGKKIDRDYSFVYWGEEEYEIPIYSEMTLSNGSLTYVQTDTETKVRYDWLPYNSRDIPKEEIKIGLRTYVEIGDKVDGVWTIAGKKVKKHSEWSEDLNINLARFFKLDETSGTVAEDSTQTLNATANNSAVFDGAKPGIINTGADLSGGYYIDLGINFYDMGIRANMTISKWVNFTGTATSDHNIIADYNADGVQVQYKNTDEVTVGVEGTGGWQSFTTTTSPMTIGMHHIFIVWGSNNLSLYVDDAYIAGRATTGTLGDSPSNVRLGAKHDGTYLFTKGDIDELGIWNTSLTSAQRTQLYNGGAGISWTDYFPTTPTIVLNAPADLITVTNPNIIFNATAKEDTTLVNMSLIVNGSYISTNSTPYNNTLTQFPHSLTSVGFYNWTVEACDNEDSCVNGTLRTLTYQNDLAITLNAPVNALNSTSQTIIFNGTGKDDTSLVNISLIVNGSYNGTNSSVFNNTLTQFPRVLADGFYNWTMEACDNFGACLNATARNLTIDSIIPALNLTAPFGLIDFGIPTINETLNWNVTDEHLGSCWFNYNFTNTTITCGDNSTTFTLTSQRNLTLYANDTFGNLASNFTTWDYKVFQNYYIYNYNTSEMETELFSINISSNGSEIMLGYLIYNGSSYLATKTGTNYIMEFNRTVTLNQIGNVSFYWSFNYGGDIINTSTYYQNVSEIIMGFCGGSLTTQTLNFTAYNEEDLARITPFDFYGTFEYWTGDGSITKNFSISNASVDNVAICININNTFHADAKIQYENTSFVKRSYYLINETLTNSLQNKKLFFLNTSTSTSFIIEVQDDVQILIPGVYIYIQRYYPGTGQYETVEMALTDISGSTIGHFEAETEDYRLVFEQDGIIIYQSGTQKIFCRETPCTLTFQTEAGIGITWEEFGAIDSFNWTLDYSEGTKIWTLVYTDTSGSIGYGRLYVYYENPNQGKITICNTTSSQLADTITCDVTGYNGTIYAAAYLSRSPEILVYLKSVLISALKAIFGLEGLMLSMFILLLLGLAGLWNPAVGIILIVVGMIVLNLIGLASFGAVTIWGVIFIALLILWNLKT